MSADQIAASVSALILELTDRHPALAALVWLVGSAAGAAGTLLAAWKTARAAWGLAAKPFATGPPSALCRAVTDALGGECVQVPRTDLVTAPGVRVEGTTALDYAAGALKAVWVGGQDVADLLSPRERRRVLRAARQAHARVGATVAEIRAAAAVALCQGGGQFAVGPRALCQAPLTREGARKETS